jgi:hypothetical protein
MNMTINDLTKTHFFEHHPTPEEQAAANIEYFIGLDLGQAHDYSALCILERHGSFKADKGTWLFHCRHLKRWPLRTPYPAIVADTASIVNDPQLQHGRNGNTLAIDATGVGAPIVDLFKREKIAAKLKAIQITGGDSVNSDGYMTRVPKRDLVSTVQVALQNDKLKIAKSLPDAQTLTSELQNFQVKITDTAHDTYGAWREGTHDDLVLAVALALWTGMTQRRLWCVA